MFNCKKRNLDDICTFKLDLTDSENSLRSPKDENAKSYLRVDRRSTHTDVCENDIFFQECVDKFNLTGLRFQL
jgi:hypothetical protein